MDSEQNINSNIDSNQTSPNNDFDVSLGGLSLDEVLPDTIYKPKKECDKGPACPHFLKGRCKFYHKKSQDARNDTSTSTNSHSTLRREFASPHFENRTKPGFKTPCHDGPECEHFKNNNCKFYHPKSSNIVKSFTPRVPCKNGQSCSKYAQGRCTFLHDDVASFNNKSKISNKHELLLSLEPAIMMKVLALPEDARNAFLSAMTN
jgi:hypothetical protein